MKNFIRLLSFMKPYWVTAVAAFAASLFYAIFNALSIWVVGSLIGTIMGTSKGEENQLMNLDGPLSINQKIEFYFNQLVAQASEMNQLKIVCFCLLITYFFKNIFYYINWVCIALIETKIIRDLRNKLFEKVQKFPISYFDKSKTGEILSIMLNDVGKIRVAFNKTFHVFFHETIGMIILIVILFSINTKLMLIVLMVLPISGYIIMKIGQSIRRKARRATLNLAKITNIINEKISSVRIVKAFNMTLQEIKYFVKANQKHYYLIVRRRKLLGLTTPVNDIIGVILACILLWYGGGQVLEYKNISPEDFMRFIILLFALLQPARKLGNSYASLQIGLIGADRVFSVLDLNLGKKKNDMIETKSIDEKIEFNSSIEYKNVNFRYERGNKDVLQNINIKINKGEKIALVGASGAGKTTFANLLLDFYEPTSGEIYLDNKKYTEIPTKLIRSIIGLVTQDPILFNDTIKNNIGYGVNANIDIKKIQEAANIANIDKYIETLNKKYGEYIGERGINLSGGQKQRLSIARAVLRNSPILILDEATSSLDSESEIKVQKAIDNLLIDRTVIMIAHRLSTIKNADRIFVFDNGKIIESGNHNELYNSNGIYTKLYDLQFGE